MAMPNDSGAATAAASIGRPVCDRPTSLSRTATFHVIAGARHEALNKTNQDEVIGYLSPWVDRVTE